MCDYIIIIFQKFLSGNNKHKTNQIKRQDIDWKKGVQDTGPTIQRPCTNLRTDSEKKQQRKKRWGTGIIEEIQRAKGYVGKYSTY